MYQGIFVDDFKLDRERYEKKLSIPHKLSVKSRRFCGESTIAEILAAKPDIVFLDQQLVEGEPDDAAQPQLGSTVAALIREDLPETPIVLITRGSIFQSETMSASRDVPRAFDDVFIKNTVARNVGSARSEILALMSGFEKLQRSKNRSLEDLWKFLGAKSDEINLLRRADPPRSSIGTENWRVSEAAHWIRKVVIRYPGIIYDSLHAACFLGMSQECFRTAPIQKEFGAAKYEGVFAPPGGRWWKNRIQRIAFDYLQHAHAPNSAVHQFTKTWNQSSKIQLNESRCIYDRTTPAETVCFIYNKPVKRKNSLPYWPDNRPTGVMDEARVSFKAIRESNEFDETLVAMDARPLVAELQRD